MEDIIEKAIKQAEEMQEGYKPFTHALVRYAEKHDFNEQQLYVMLQKVIDDMEEADPLLKMAHDIAKPLSEMVHNCVNDSRDSHQEDKETLREIRDVSGKISKLAEDIIDEL